MYRRFIILLSALLVIAITGCEDDNNSDSDPIPAAAPDTLKSSYSSSVTLTDNPEAPVDYVGMSGVTFENGSELIVEPGVVIGFDSGVQVRFAPGSEVHMNGTEGNRIVLRGIEEVSGYWAGIFHQTTDVTNNWDFVDIKHTGSDEVGESIDTWLSALYLDDDGRLTVKNCRFINNAGRGVTAFSGTRLPDFTGNHFERNTLAPIAVSHDGVQYLNNTLTFSDNTASYVDINNALQNCCPADELNGTHTWTFNQRPIHISGMSLSAGDQLTIEPGVELLVKGGGQFTWNGSVFINGTASDSVRIGHVDASSGSWNGIYLGKEASTYDWEHLSLGYAGREPTDTFHDKLSNVFLDNDVTLNISNSSVHHSGGWGISYEEGGSGDATLNASGMNYYANTSGATTVDGS